MIDRHTVFEIHRMANEGLSERKISKRLHLDRKTVKKYLNEPNPEKQIIKRASKLDPFKEHISILLEKDCKASSSVIFQHLQKKGFDGKITILRDYLNKVRPNHIKKQVFTRFESPPGHQCQIDWGHFGSISYGVHNRKLYCFAVIECHSRLLYLEFSHSQKQAMLHSCLLNAFSFFNGVCEELVHDNMLTAVIEHVGPLVRFNGAFLEFLRPFKITPRACNVRKPHEKGKVEKGAIHYIRHNFWPLRSFKDLNDLQGQANEWRDQVANKRIHSTTGERPVDRFKEESMHPLIKPLPDCRETESAKVHSDFSIRFDGNRYTVTPWAIGKQVVIKADLNTVTIYYKDRYIATHSRCWKRRERIELPEHKRAALESQKRYWKSEETGLFISMGEAAKTYLERLAATSEPLGKAIKKLLELRDEYGSYSLVEAIKKATLHNAYGAHYIENILYQEMTPTREHLPVRLKKENLNRIRLEEPSLAEFDTFVLEKNKHERNR